MNLEKQLRRSELEADVLYLDMSVPQYFYTPNPPGVVWLTTEEADEMFGKDTPANSIDSLED
jgi:hypothetical protein